MTLSENDIEKWRNYYWYFYFHDDMTFSDFLHHLASGQIPKRESVDWSRVIAPYDTAKRG